MIAIDAGLFETGRPVLIAPPLPPQRIGENILIAWNCSTEQARATAAPIPRDLCNELSISSQTLYRHVSPTGELRANGTKILKTTRAVRAQSTLPELVITVFGSGRTPRQYPA
jgi:hypothetical protein